MGSAMTRSKAIGTGGETQVVNWFKAQGFRHATRLVLHGSKDIGDVSLGDGMAVVIEVKSGHAAENATDTRMRIWLEELHAEMANATELRGTPHYGVLIVKRKAMGAAQVGGWWALTPYLSGAVVRWRLDEWLRDHRGMFDSRELIRNSWEDDE